MLRSSSTPVLGSLLPPFSDSSSSSDLHGSTQKHPPSPIHGQISYYKGGGSHNFCKPFRSSSIAESPGACSSFRRIQSEGNLEDLVNDFQDEKLPNENNNSSEKGRMYLATGIGAAPATHDLEEHYKRMLEEDPRNPLVLRNYANFLYQVKGDLRGAEEYYSRAVLASPADGDILAQYAKLTWELHHDQERANHYFEKAVRVRVRASPEDRFPVYELKQVELFLVPEMQ